MNDAFSQEINDIKQGKSLPEYLPEPSKIPPFGAKRTAAVADKWIKDIWTELCSDLKLVKDTWKPSPCPAIINTAIDDFIKRGDEVKKNILSAFKETV